MKKRTNRRTKVLSFILAILTALNSVCFAIPAAAVEPPVKWKLYSGRPSDDPDVPATDEYYADADYDKDDPTPEPASGVRKLYLVTYLSDEKYQRPDDEIELVRLGEDFDIDDSALQIGTATEPFKGTITFDDTAIFAIKTTKALFAYLSTDATITYTARNTEFVIKPTALVQNDSALFADHIVKGTVKDTLDLKIKCVIPSAGDKYYAGVIGTMDAGAKVNLWYDASEVHGSFSQGDFTANVYSHGNAGLLCGTMKAGALLTVKSLDVDTTNPTSVTSEFGAAGGLVGAMECGAGLTLECDYDASMISVAANGSSAAGFETPYVPPVLTMMAMSPKRSLPSDPYGIDDDSEAAAETRSVPLRGLDAKTVPAASFDYNLGKDTETALDYDLGKDTEPAIKPETKTETARRGTKGPLRNQTPSPHVKFPTLTGYDTYAGYAGGIVGYAAGATVTFASGVTVTVSNATPGAVSGKTAAGGVAGYALDDSYTVGNDTIPAPVRLILQDDAALTVSGKADAEEYAGGIYGYYQSNDARTNGGVTKGTGEITLSGTYSSTKSNKYCGGVFGYYEAPSQTQSFILSDFTIDDPTLSSAGSTGGVIGYLKADGDVTITGDNYPSGTAYGSILAGGTQLGGLIGTYKNNGELSNTMSISGVKVASTLGSSSVSSGGLIGAVADAAAYISAGNIDAAFSGTALFGGGLIGDLGSHGSFLDVSDTVAVDGTVYGGLVGNLGAGVLRLRGTTDVSSADTTSGGQLVYQMDRGLVYALGDGNGTGWTLKRKGSGNLDDIYSWGEVVRIGANGVTANESDLFTVDGTAHTVTVAAAVPAMATKLDFAKTALNIQLNTDANVGALQFTAGNENKSSTLLSGALSITADINLTGTGLIGLTRDDGANAAYQGTFNGNGKTLTLATGEAYGVNSALTPLTSPRNCGGIYAHGYVGLFAKAGGGSSQQIKNLKIGGTINAYPNVADNRVGGIVAQVVGNLELHTVETFQTINGMGTASASIGGAIGEVKSNNAAVKVTSSQFRTDMTDADTNRSGNIGGVIGSVASSGNTLTFTTVTLGADQAGQQTTAVSVARYGGLIGTIFSASTNRKVELKGVTVAGLAVTAKNGADKLRSGGLGGLLGYSWLSTDVEILSADQLQIGKTGYTPSFTVTDGKYGNFAGLVYRATGYWDIVGLTLTGATFTNNANTGGSFGMLVNEGTGSDGALYLELKQFDNGTNHYDISAATVSSTKKLNVFDELVAYTVSGSEITANNAAIVSVHTTDGADVAMNGSSCNTYQNQTAYGKTAANTGRAHSYSRYYYNLDKIRAKVEASQALRPGEKLLLWSLQKYASSKISGYFTGHGFSGNTIPAANYDMLGLSYYPVSVDGVTVSAGATLKFYNEQIEAGEGVGSGGSDSLVRSTRTATQHLMMHSGLLYNTSCLTVNGVTLQGSVGATSGNVAGAVNGSGFLVRGTLHDGEGEEERSTIQNVQLDGAVVSAGNDYAPLLINKVGSDTDTEPTKLTVDGVWVVKDNNGTTQYAENAKAASSLIGDAAGVKMTLRFRHISLDGRDGAKSIGTLDADYGTKQSLFTRATLLNKFEYSDALSSGSYTYSKDDDYGANAKRVTYGKEIDVVPAEFTGYTQNMYYDDSGKFTHPEAAADSAYGHFNNTNDANYPVWLPYVYTRYNDANHTHELAINQKLATMGSEGCGTYDDPYPISSGSQLATIAKIINGTEPENGYALRLPATLNPNATHGDPASCDSYAFNSSTHKFGTTYTFDEVREYLAGAYYYLKNDIVIEDANFPGLGAASLSSINNEYQYAFRGAISGKKNDSEVYTITNQTDKPLIANSNGCVVRDLKVVVEKDVTINSTGSGDYYTYYSGLNSYGILIGKVMGGDTFIDKVDVSFGTGYALTIGGDNYRYVPVGGYVGVLANGCVVFRNMAANCGLRGGNFADLNTAANAANYLYANPLIGRVLNGFAFSEGCDVDNTSKDYEIPKLNPNETSKLSNNAGTITVPNGQALWVLGAIVNSGAAAATSDAGAYPTGTDNEALFSGFRKYTAVRCGSGGSSTLFAGYEDCNYKTEAGKTPYIITAYADASCRTAATYATTTVNITGDCSGNNKVPKGFRGIGRLYWISGNANNTEPKKYRLNGTVTVQGTDAAGTTPTQRVVELDMKLREYFVETKYRSSRDFAVAGFGLINYMYADDDKLTAKNLTMKGGVSYKVYYDNRIEFATPTKEQIDDKNKGGYPNLNVGAVVGQLKGNLTMTDVLMDTLKIEGFKHAGGLVGQCSTSSSSVKEFTRCGSTDEGVLTLETMYTAGGLVGHIKNPKKVTIDGGTGTTVRIDLIESHITSTPNYVSAGGLVGYCLNACNNGMTIKKMNVVGAGTNKLITTSGLALDQNSGVGGLIGVVSAFGNIDIENCEVSGVNLWGKNAGGAIGWVYNMGDGKQIKLDDVEITGATGSAAKPTIRGMASGGLLGNVENSNANTLLLQNCTVSGYAIACGDDAAGTTASNTTSERAAGGFIGLYYRNSNSASKVYKLDLANMKAENCDLSTEYTKENDRNGIGGMIGVLRPNGTCGPTVTGNNILLKGLLLTQKGSFPGSGALVGSNSGGYGVVKLAAVSVQNVKHKAGANDAALIQRAIGKEKASNPAPTDEFNGTGGYVIFADYGGASAGLSANTTEAVLSTTGTAPNTRVVLNTTAGAQPYVPANPKKLLDSTGTFLTGDGLATGNTINFTKQQLPIFSILGDTGDFDYQYAKDNDSTGFDTARLAASSFTTYLTEETDHSGGYDVAALLINSSENIDEAHYKLNTYLDMLTNTRYNYASSEVSGICNVKICNLDRNEQTKTFSVSGNGTSGASVEVGSGETINRFVVKSYDNTKNRLTLLDLQFLDPADQSTVVYHLYVPVFVRKVIDFSFRSGLMNDTLYTKNNSTYTSRSSVQNSGSPVTLWFSYSLDRSASEWATALESGEKLVDSFRFTLKMDQLADALPSTTDLVLVEKSTGKAYYSTFGSAVSNGVLSLSAFSDTSGGHPREIADLLGFSMAAHTGEGKGKFVVAANAAETTFKMGGVSYRPYNSETDSAVATTYDLNTNNQSYNELTAAYYLSFLTTHQNSGGISRYQIDCPKTLSGTPASCSHWNGETSGQYSNLFLGDIFDVSDTDFRSILDGCDAPTQTESSTPYVVTKAKSTIHIHAQTTVTLQNYQVTSFSEPQNQAFVVFLKRTDATGSKTAIYGDPTLSGTYTITQGGVTSSPVEYAPAKMSKTDGFAQFMLNNPLTLTQNADTATIEADLYISYNGNANAIKAQFPSQTETNGGTEVFLKSSISSASVNVDQIAYSTSFERVTNDGYKSKYFSEDTVPEAYLSFDPVIRGENGTIIEKGDFGKLGINPKDPGDDVHTGDLTHMEVDTIAVLDYSAYLEKYPLFSYDTLKLTLTLQQKEDSHDYGDSLYFDTYFNSITVAGTTFTANDLNVSSFEKPIPKNGYGFSEFVDADGYASIPISFDVKTGTVLENAGLRYANYKVTLTVQLYRSTAPNTGLLTAGLTPQHIIYTNAKIYPDFIG